MYIALSELRFARGRFALMGAVIALITLLVVLLSGLTAGLTGQSVSALRSLPGTHLAFSAPPQGQALTFADSTVTAAQVETWTHVRGVASATPLGITPARLVAGERRIAVTIFGVDPDAVLAPHPRTGSALADTGSVVLSEAAAEGGGLGAGDRVMLADRSYLVAGVARSASFDHTPVVWLSTVDWRASAGTGAETDRAPVADGGFLTGGDGFVGRDAVLGTVVVLDAPGVDLSAAAAATGTVARPTDATFSAVGSFDAEHGSLSLMRILLFAISALVVGAFFTVWTVQRAHDLAVLKAIGASTGYLLRDALTQALVVLALGGLAGTVLASAVGGFAARTVPFVASPGTTLVPLLVMVGVGMAGAAVAVRQVTSVDPLLALGASR